MVRILIIVAIICLVALAVVSIILGTEQIAARVLSGMVASL